jgi:hypothetical protein
MLSTRYLLDHIDALVRLSHEVKDREASAKLMEMADELRMMVCVADISELAATLNKDTTPAPVNTAPETGRSANSKPSEPTHAKPKGKMRKRPLNG